MSDQAAVGVLDGACQEAPTFLSLVRELFWPARPAWLLLHLAALLVGLDYWLSSFWYEGSTPVEILAMYRPGGDTQYVGLVATLARGYLGESVLFESAGTGTQAFPLGSLVVHVLCVALLGSAGHVVADGLMALAYYLALALFLRVVGLPWPWARIASLLTAAGVTTRCFAWLASKNLFLPFGFLFWGNRLPRPLVTEVAMLAVLSLALALALYRDARGSKVAWAAWGIALSWLLQGDIHGAAAVGLFSGIALLVAMVQLRDWRTATRLAAVSVACFVLCSVPFIWQQLTIHPDVARRWGAFPVSRLDPPSELLLHLPRMHHVLLLLGLAFVARRFHDAALPRARGRLLPVSAAGHFWLLLAIAVCGWIAMPVFSALTGRAIQLYHFADRLTRLTSYVALAAICLGTWLVGRAFLVRWLRLTLAIRGGWPLAAGLSVLASGVALEQVFREHVVSYGNPRGDFAGTGSYKDDLIELGQVLRSPRFANASVMGTLDHSVNLWWVSFRRGFSLLPDPFHTSRPDAELERRFVNLCHELGASESRFRRLAESFIPQVFWVSEAKYNVSPLYSFAPRDSYTPAQQQAIVNASITAGWNIQIPKSEVDRLVKLYTSSEDAWGGFRQPDVLVLNRIDKLGTFSPDTNKYRLAFSNRTFHVYQRLGSVGG